MLNPRGSFSLDLSLFGSWVQDIQPTDLPAGASPDNSDCFYLPGGVFTRPALKKMLTAPVADTPTVVSVKDFELPSGDALTMFLDSLGNLYSNDSDNPADTTNLLTVIPGVQFKAETAFDKQWYAFFSGPLAAAFSMNPFVGVDVPAYFNGTNLQRVTTDAPGISPTFSNVQTAPVNLAATLATGSLTVTAVTAGEQTYSSPNVYVWGTLTYTCSTPVPANWIGATVTITGCTGTNSSFANTTGTIQLVSGSTFIIAMYISQIGNTNPVTLTGQSATATVSASGYYLTRASNLVTALLGTSAPPFMTAGFWVSVINADGSLINGPSWTITNIVRDNTGRVTVTISTQLQNLAVGSQLYVAASDSTDFPAGYQTVTEVVSASGGTTIFTYSSLSVTPASSSSGGSVYQTWSPQAGINGNAAQIVKAGFNAAGQYFIQYYQLGPDAAISTTGGTAQAQIQAQAASGPRSGVCMFASQDGAITAPSVPVQLNTGGNQNLLLASNIPIGPPGTTRRIIALTPSEGSNFYYITPATIPNIGASQAIVATGTVINDNASTSIVMDFSDTQLTASTQIDIAGNNLFNQVVLAPCLGNIEYQGRMGWWGEINNVKNFLNMGFDGGFNPPSGTCALSGYGYGTVTWESGALFNSAWVNSSVVIGGYLCVAVSVSSPTSMMVSGLGLTGGTHPFYVVNPVGALPLGWDASAGDGMGTLVGWPDVTNLPGFAYQLAANSNSMIQQGAAKDYYGAPILLPSTSYTVRAKMMRLGPAPNPSGELVVEFYSPSQGSLGSVGFVVAAMSATELSWETFSAPIVTTPYPIPSDLLLRIYLQGPTPSCPVAIDELEAIPTKQPVAYDQMRLSYYQNPFGFDAITGVLSVDPSQSVTGAFRQRGYLYLIGGDGAQSLFQAQNNGTGEPDTWSVNEFASNCGCSGPCAVDSTEDEGIWVGRYGCRVFDGASLPKKISQAWASTFELINWAAQTTMWVKNDPVDRLLFFGIPIGTNATPNLAVQMSYRLNDAAYNVPDEVHVSPYSGKMIDTDLTRRWSPWNRTLNCADMVTRPLLSGLPGTAKTIVFGGGNGQAIGSGTGYGNLYLLDTYDYFPLNPALGTWNCADDDYGGIPMYYTTYFFFNHDIEQQPQLGQFRKIFNYVAAHALGVGSLKITPLIDALQNAQRPFPMPPLSLTDPGYDLEFHPITKGNRVAYRIEPYIGSPGVAKALALTHLIVSARKDLVFPVRGTIFGG